MRGTVATRAGASAADPAVLERVLEALQYERLTPLDVRIILRVSDDERTIPDIAAAMGHPPSAIRRASRRLVARGLLRRRRRPGRPVTITLAPTDSSAHALHRIGTSLLGQASDCKQTRSARVERSVVVGYDGSDAAMRALQRGAVAVGPNGTLTVVSVWPRPPASGLAPEAIVEAAYDPANLLAEARLRLAGATMSEIRTVAAEGDPATEIADVARSADADLIVVGRTGGRFMSRAIFGSVAVRVVELSRCDVLVVA